MLQSTVVILGATLGVMALLEVVISKIFRPNDSAAKVVAWVTKPDVLACVGFLATLFVVGQVYQDWHTVGHVLGVLDYRSAILVAAMMFQSLQLGSFITHALAGIQRLVKGDERIFNAITLSVMGLMSSALSEAAVAAAGTRQFAQVNTNQSEETQKQLGVHLAAAIGVGGGITPIAAPSIVIAARKFGWSFAETALYLGPIVLLSLAFISFRAYRLSENCENSALLQTRKLSAIDWVNLTLWSLVLYFGVFVDHAGLGVFTAASSITGMLAVVGISFIINLLYYMHKEIYVDDQHSHVRHIIMELVESGLVFGFLFSLMFMGDINAQATQYVEAVIPNQHLLRQQVYFFVVDFMSSGLDNAFVVYQLAELAAGTADQIAIAWASLTGGMMTIVGNAPNIVIIGLLVKQGVKIGFIEWIRIATPIGVGLKLMGAIYIFVICGLM